jgi:hypothetical protein
MTCLLMFFTRVVTFVVFVLYYKSFALPFIQQNEKCFVKRIFICNFRIFSLFSTESKVLLSKKQTHFRNHISTYNSFKFLHPKLFKNSSLSLSSVGDRNSYLIYRYSICIHFEIISYKLSLVPLKVKH